MAGLPNVPADGEHCNLHGKRRGGKNLRLYPTSRIAYDAEGLCASHGSFVRELAEHPDGQAWLCKVPCKVPQADGLLNPFALESMTNSSWGDPEVCALHGKRRGNANLCVYPVALETYQEEGWPNTHGDFDSSLGGCLVCRVACKVPQGENVGQAGNQVGIPDMKRMREQESPAFFCPSQYMAQEMTGIPGGFGMMGQIPMGMAMPMDMGRGGMGAPMMIGGMHVGNHGRMNGGNSGRDGRGRQGQEREPREPNKRRKA